MKLFESNKRRQPPTHEASGNALGNRMNAAAQGLAGRLQQYSERLPLAGKKGCLFLFVVIVMGINCLIIYKAVWRSKDTEKLSVQPISVPKYTTRPPVGLQLVPIPEDVYRSVIIFEHYWDSLGRMKGGKAAQDSITRNRPGLLDTVAQVKAMYLMQHAKK